MAVPKIIFDRRLGLALLSVAIYLALFVVITYTLGKGMSIASDHSRCCHSMGVRILGRAYGQER